MKIVIDFKAKKAINIYFRNKRSFWFIPIKKEKIRKAKKELKKRNGKTFSSRTSPEARAKINNVFADKFRRRESDVLRK